jgi:hypothetical protein
MKTLEEALQVVDLEPGRTYRVEVRGQTVEVRVLETTGTAAQPSDFADETMMEPWIALPEPKWVGTVKSRLAPPELPDIPEIPRDDET